MYMYRTALIDIDIYSERLYQERPRIKSTRAIYVIRILIPNGYAAVPA